MVDDIIVRPRLRPIELKTLNGAVNCLINKLKSLLEANPNDKELLWEIVCARRMRARLTRSLIGKRGSAPAQVMYEALKPIQMTASTEYIRALDAMEMVPDISYTDEYPIRLFTVFVDAAVNDAIRGFRDGDEGWKFAKDDVELMIRYLKEFRTKNGTNT